MKNEDKQLHIRLPDEVYKKLKVRCVYEDTSMQEYVAKQIAESLAEYLNEKQPDQGKAARKSKRRR